MRKEREGEVARKEHARELDLTGVVRHEAERTGGCRS